jgi:hypothetical protein
MLFAAGLLRVFFDSDSRHRSFTRLYDVTQSRTLSWPFLLTLDRIQGKERSRIQTEGSIPCPLEPAA